MCQIEAIIKSGANENVEFLSEIDELIDFAKISVSFANRNGGSIFIGINEKGKVIGVNPGPELILINQVKDYIEGELIFESVRHLVKHHCIIEVKVSKTEIPLLLKLNNDLKMYYYRVNSNSIEANKIIERYLNMRRFGKTVIESKHHSDFLDKLGDDRCNLSLLYKMMNMKPNEVDKLTAELLFLNKLKILVKDNKFFYSQLKS